MQRNDASNAVVRARNNYALRNRNLLTPEPTPKPVGPVATAPVAATSSWERAFSGGGGSLGETVRDANRRSRNPDPPPPPPPPPPDYVPGGDEESTTTDPSETPMPDPYPTVLPSLSAEQLGALAERRRVIDERLKLAEAESERRRSFLEASAERAKQSAERTSRRSIQDFMREAAGRSVARSPMIAGRFVRRAGEDLRLKYGEIETNLSNEIMALQDLVSRAELERDTELAKIEQERVNMQADLERLFPAASMYGA